MATRVGGRTGDGSGPSSVARPSARRRGRASTPGAHLPAPEAWQDAAMTDQEARYDSIAEAYAELWSPVHRPSTLALLDEVEPDVSAGARRLLDVGCGTGALAAEAVRRWPQVRRRRRRRRRPGCSGRRAARASRAAGRRIARRRFRQAPADRLPFDDGTFDLALTSFVLQLVPSPPSGPARDRGGCCAPGGRSPGHLARRAGPLAAGRRLRRRAARRAGFEPRDTGGGRRRRCRSRRRRRSRACGGRASARRRRRRDARPPVHARSRTSGSSTGSTTRTSSTRWTPTARGALERTCSRGCGRCPRTALPVSRSRSPTRPGAGT